MQKYDSNIRVAPFTANQAIAWLSYCAGSAAVFYNHYYGNSTYSEMGFRLIFVTGGALINSLYHNVQKIDPSRVKQDPTEFPTFEILTVTAFAVSRLVNLPEIAINVLDVLGGAAAHSLWLKVWKKTETFVDLKHRSTNTQTLLTQPLPSKPITTQKVIEVAKVAQDPTAPKLLGLQKLNEQSLRTHITSSNKKVFEPFLKSAKESTKETCPPVIGYSKKELFSPKMEFSKYFGYLDGFITDIFRISSFKNAAENFNKGIKNLVSAIDDSKVQPLEISSIETPAKLYAKYEGIDVGRNQIVSWYQRSWFSMQSDYAKINSLTSETLEQIQTDFMKSLEEALERNKNRKTTLLTNA